MAEEEVRRIIFKAIAGDGDIERLKRLSLPEKIILSMERIRKGGASRAALEMYERLARYDSSHVAILLKSATEWVIAKYVKIRENWGRRYDEWKKEKESWERGHPELTPEAIAKYNEIFREMGIKDKRPRICMGEELKKSQDDCNFAGKQIKTGKIWVGHSPVCLKYWEFAGRWGKEKNRKKYFEENAKEYLLIRARQRQLPKSKVFDELFKKVPQARSRFSEVWQAYLDYMGINEETIIRDYQCSFPHCTIFSADRKCGYNRHTENCLKYKDAFEKLAPDLQALEKTYREWRNEYLKGPSKPKFGYPSSRTLPSPKIFGKEYFEVDFKNSTVGLRLDNMPPKRFLNFTFEPWPPDYDIQPDDINITSVHLNFVGTRARIGFRFEVKHAPSRFTITQDELDDLRRKKYPRVSQDQAFLKEARERLFNTFNGDPRKDLRILAVDLGTEEAKAVVFQGENYEKTIPLSIIKREQLYKDKPAKEKEGKKGTREEKEAEETIGLNKGHVGRHLTTFSVESKEIAKRRKAQPEATLEDFDLRRLTTHVRWMIRDWVRLNASQIIKAADENGVDLIIFESLRGFRAPGYDIIDPDKKRRLAFFAYGSIRRKVVEKAVERGMRVITVPYFKSSQHCSTCGREQEDKKRWGRNKEKRKFECENAACGYRANSDENASRVLAKVFFGQIQLPSSSDRDKLREFST